MQEKGRYNARNCCVNSYITKRSSEAPHLTELRLVIQLCNPAPVETKKERQTNKKKIEESRQGGKIVVVVWVPSHVGVRGNEAADQAAKAAALEVPSEWARRSTSDQLLLVYSEVSRQVDEGGVVDVLLFYYSKAFDVVRHDILIAKLHCLGVQGSTLQWISSFLSGRLMRVAVKGSLSKPRKVDSGIPQGSVLGPLLFLIYINHIASHLSCLYKIFADDLKIYACVHHRSSPDNPHSTADVQSDIDVLYTTSLSWGLQMNPKKCADMRFSRSYSDLTPAQYLMNGVVIPSVKSHLDLGVLVDTNMKFHDHIRSTVHKAGGMAQNFLNSTVCTKPDFMLFLLTTHIRPIIEYCSCIWHTGYQGDLRLLESVQKRWTKQIESVKEIEYGDRLRALSLY